MAKSRQLFECRKHLGQPCLKERALDLDDIPVQDQKRDSTDAVDREERHRRGVIVGSGLGGGVNDREDGAASSREGKRLVVNEQLLAAEALGLTVVRFPSPPPRADETVAKQGFNCLAARKL